MPEVEPVTRATGCGVFIGNALDKAGRFVSADDCR
jgi:hypothetical protein